MKRNALLKLDRAVSVPINDEPKRGGQRVTAVPTATTIVYQLVGQHSREDANGLPQACFIGVSSGGKVHLEGTAGRYR